MPGVCDMMGNKGEDKRETDSTQIQKFINNVKKAESNIVVREYEPSFTDNLHTELVTESLNIAKQIHQRWSIKEKGEQKYRFVAFFMFIAIFFLQLLILNLLIFLQGNNIVNLKDNILYAYMSIVFVEIVGIVAITFKYIFSERKVAPLEITYKIIDSANKYNNYYYKENISAKNNQDNLNVNNKPKTFKELREIKKGES